jgi:sucrose phosphorylase
VLKGAEKRSINRRTYDEASLMRMLDDADCWVSQVARGMRRIIRRRIEQPAFHPNAEQKVLDVGPAVFGLYRERPGVQRLIALTNVTTKDVRVRVPIAETGGATLWNDVLSRARYQASDGMLSVPLPPYGVAWLSAE